MGVNLRLLRVQLPHGWNDQPPTLVFPGRQGVLRIPGPSAGATPCRPRCVLVLWPQGHAGGLQAGPDRPLAHPGRRLMWRTGSPTPSYSSVGRPGGSGSGARDSNGPVGLHSSGTTAPTARRHGAQFHRRAVHTPVDRWAHSDRAWERCKEQKKAVRPFHWCRRRLNTDPLSTTTRIRPSPGGQFRPSLTIGCAHQIEVLECREIGLNRGDPWLFLM